MSEKLYNNVIEVEDKLMDNSVYEFLKNLLDPDMYGHAVTAEVRDEARALIGLKKVETV